MKLLNGQPNSSRRGQSSGGLLGLIAFFSVLLIPELRESLFSLLRELFAALHSL